MLEIKINLQILNASFILNDDKKIKIPFNEPTRHDIQGFIYNIIKDNKLHEQSYKGFTFTKLNSICKKYIGKNKVTYRNNNCHFNILSTNDNIINAFKENISFKKIYKIGDIFVNVLSIETINTDFNGTIYRVKTIEPIFLKAKNKRITCQNNDFITVLCRNISHRLKRDFTPNDIEIINCKQKYEKYNINISHVATHCELIIKCSTDEIMKLYYEGIGNLTSSGFGSIKIIENGN